MRHADLADALRRECSTGGATGVAPGEPPRRESRRSRARQERACLVETIVFRIGSLSLAAQIAVTVRLRSRSVRMRL